MRIEATVGVAPADATTEDNVYKLTLTATNNSERKWLAGLLSAVKKTAPAITHHREVPHLIIEHI